MSTSYVYRNLMIGDIAYLDALNAAAVAVGTDADSESFTNAPRLCRVGDASHTPVAVMVWIPTTVPMIQEMLFMVHAGALPAPAIVAFIRCIWNTMLYDDSLEWDGAAFTTTGPVHSFAGRVIDWGAADVLASLGLMLMPVPSEGVGP